MIATVEEPGEQQDHLIHPRDEPPVRIETTEEAGEKLELMVEAINQARTDLREEVAQDSKLDAHLDQAAGLLLEAINRLTDLDESMTGKEQARMVARTALRRYADIDDGLEIGGDADGALDADVESMVRVLATYTRRKGIDGAEAEVALDRCKVLLRREDASPR